MLQRDAQEVLKQNAAVAGLVRMLPARAALVPILEGFLQMKLDRVDQLAVRATHHHLIPAQIRRCQQLEAFGHPIELQTMVLPDTKNARIYFRLAVRQAMKDWIFECRDADETVLILDRPVLALFMLFHFVQRYHTGAEA